MNKSEISNQTNMRAQYNNYFSILKNKEYDYYVVVTRKGYYYLSLEYRNKPTILRDRDILKKYDFSDFVGKRILLFDDTVGTGATLKRIRDILENRTENKVAKIDIAAFSISPQVLKHKKKAFENNTLFFYNLMNEDEMSKFSLLELQEIHDAMTPYVIDLPVFKKIKLSKETFDKLISSDRDNWKYHEYSFHLNEKIYKNGFLQYDNAALHQIFGGALQECVIKCRYEELKGIGESLYEVLFTPFVILKSVNAAEMKCCAEILYEGTAYEHYIKKTSENQDYVGLYRDVVYNLSYYLGILFEKYMSSRYNVYGLELSNQLTATKQNESLKKSIESIFQEFSAERYVNKLNNCSFSYWRKPMISVSEKSDLKFETVRQYILSQLAIKKLKLVQNGGKHMEDYVTYEDIENLLSQKYTFKSPKQYSIYFVRLILLALDFSFMSNDLVYVNGEIKRVFRYGENSELYLGYDFSLFYPAVYAYYNNVKGKKEEYCIYYETFVKFLHSYFQNNNYFKYNYISQEEFDFMADYFNFKKDIVDKEIRNKRFLLESSNAEKPYVRAVEQFVSNLTFCRQGE